MAKMSKATPQKMVPKKTTPAPVDMPRKPFEVDMTLRLVANVAGLLIGQPVVVKEVQFDGAVFIVDILTGKKHGATLRVRADDLALLV